MDDKRKPVGIKFWLRNWWPLIAFSAVIGSISATLRPEGYGYVIGVLVALNVIAIVGSAIQLRKRKTE